jgi:hypothetical protein
MNLRGMSVAQLVELIYSANQELSSREQLFVENPAEIQERILDLLVGNQPGNALTSTSIIKALSDLEEHPVAIQTQLNILVNEGKVRFQNGLYSSEPIEGREWYYLRKTPDYRDARRDITWALKDEPKTYQGILDSHSELREKLIAMNVRRQTIPIDLNPVREAIRARQREEAWERKKINIQRYLPILVNEGVVCEENGVFHLC